jgi:FAD/FMN-containing dehydrogenase
MALTSKLVEELRAIVGTEALVISDEGRLVYECDMHTFYKGMPDAVALPSTAGQVQAIVTACRREGVPIVPRGSGTGLIGGAMAARGETRRPRRARAILGARGLEGRQRHPRPAGPRRGSISGYGE